MPEEEKELRVEASMEEAISWNRSVFDFIAGKS